MRYLIAVLLSITSLSFIETIVLAGPDSLQAGTKFINVDRLSLGITKFKGNRDPMTPDIPQDAYHGRMAMQLDLSVTRFLFWENNVHVESVGDTPKTVGWHWIAGIRATSWLDLIAEHHSRHVMDQAQERYNPKTGRREKFPVEDSYGVRINIIGGKK